MAFAFKMSENQGVSQNIDVGADFVRRWTFQEILQMCLLPVHIGSVLYFDKNIIQLHSFKMLPLGLET